MNIWGNAMSELHLWTERATDATATDDDFSDLCAARRRGVWLAAGALLAGALLSTTARADFPNGVASGDVSQRAAVLWARSDTRGPLLFEVSRNASFHPVANRQFAWVTNPLEPVKRSIAVLEPDTLYHYRAIDRTGARAHGVFRTAAPLWRQRGLRFGVSGDARGDNAPFRSVLNAPSRELDFFANLGDTIYADIESPALPGVAQATTLDEFRLKHAEVYSERDGVNGLRELRESTSLLVTIDDHEVTNDFAGGAPPDTDPRFDQTGSFINETQLYAKGLRAFQEFNPLRNRFYRNTGDPRTAFKRMLYRERFYGRDAAVFVLDARSFRDAELVAANLLDPADVARFLVQSFDPSRTLLGRVQIDDLKAGLTRAQQRGVTWKFVMVPEPIQNFGVLGASDRFEGYAAERTELLAHIHANGITNVVFIAADIHGSVVNNLTYQVGPGQPQIPTGAFEVTTGAIAFDAPFGPTVVELAAGLGLVSPAQKAFYDSLPLPGKESFLATLVNGQLAAFGLDPIGLAGSPIDATLLAGSYSATHTWGWTEFEIDAATQALTVTTYGTAPFDTASAPAVMMSFEVDPQ
jgi:phosphodiesterase/alkaline phosphatase D-like protein